MVYYVYMHISYFTHYGGLAKSTGFGYAGFNIVTSLQALGHKVTFNDPAADVQLMFTQPPAFLDFNGLNIGFTPWESTQVPDEWLPGFAHCNQFWATSHLNKEWYEAQGITVNKVYPHGINHDWTPKHRKRRRKLRILHCLSMDTDVLTSNGWKTFDSLSESDQLATVDDNDVIEYLPHYDKFKKFSDEGLVMVDNWNFNIAVTPEHRVLMRPQHHDEFAWATAKDLDTNKYTKLYLPVKPTYNGEDSICGSREFFNLPTPHARQTVINESVDLGNLLELMGWYISEGWRVKHSSKTSPKTGKKYGSTAIGITQKKNAAYIKEIHDLVNSFGAKSCHTSNGDIKFTHADLYQIFAECGDGFYNKRIPRWVFKLNKDLLLRLLSSLIKGDGARTLDAGCYYTSSPQLVDDIQELLFLCGYRTSVLKREPRSGGTINGREVHSTVPGYAVNFTINHSGSIVPKHDVKTVEHHGYVWCVSNDNGTLVTRRNGKIAILGNCGSPAPRKSGQLVLNTFIKLFEGNDNVILTIKSDGPTDLRYDPDIPGVLHRPDYFSNVNLIERVLDDDELISLFHQHDILVYPSYGEGFGFIPLQALATGMPVIFNTTWAEYKEFSVGLDLRDRLVKSPWPHMHPGQMLEPNKDDLEKQMLEAYYNYQKYADKAFEQAPEVHEKFDWVNVTEEAFDGII